MHKRAIPMFANQAPPARPEQSRSCSSEMTRGVGHSVSRAVGAYHPWFWQLTTPLLHDEPCPQGKACGQLLSGNHTDQDIAICMPSRSELKLFSKPQVLRPCFGSMSALMLAADCPLPCDRAHSVHWCRRCWKDLDGTRRPSQSDTEHRQ
eukprot:jgi/Ulvmu1/404/UM001_0411.1